MWEDREPSEWRRDPDWLALNRRAIRRKRIVRVTVAVVILAVLAALVAVALSGKV